MQITDIINRKIKIGKTSITIKTDEGKTAGVVTNCIHFSVMSPRDKFSLQKYGLPLDIAKNCVLCDGEIYYIHDIRLQLFVKENKTREEYLQTEKRTIQQLEQDASKAMEKGLKVLDCIVI